MPKLRIDEALFIELFLIRNEQGINTLFYKFNMIQHLLYNAKVVLGGHAHYMHMHAHAYYIVREV